MHARLFPCFLILALGCTTSTQVEPEARPISELGAVGDASEALIGASGGEIVLGEAVVRIPAGALPETTMIRLSIDDAAIPESFTAYSPVYRLEPALALDAAIALELPHVGDDEVATVFFNTEETSGFAARETTSTEGGVSASLTHVSRMFVGVACQGEECCRRATSALDVLLMLDNSGSMSEEQDKLAQQLPVLIAALATGDADGDGVQDFPVVDSLQMGSVSSDMGTGGHTIPTCNDPLRGDDGILMTRGANPGCAATYPAIQEFDGSGDVSVFAESVSCVAMTGTDGCGFEQPLDAMLRAAAPSTMLSPGGTPITFSDGAGGHGDGANAGLVRDGAVLALINLTDEDDCSAADPDIFNRDSARYTSPDLNLRCSTYTDAVHPASRFADSFLALKDSPSELVYATISGIPSGLDGESAASILNDPRMAETVDPEFPSQLLPTCEGSGGVAYPARRLVEVAGQLEAAGAAGLTSSICDADFSAAIRAILGSVAASASGTCH